MHQPLYPFTALVGQERLKTALLLNAINPAIGGVLIRGHKGAAKSTAARALAALLPPIRTVAGCAFNCDPGAPCDICPTCRQPDREVETRPAPFVTLPLGATEDRVVGTLDIQRALREREHAFQPGVLAAAHRGVLYIDEVNLLADHLVDVLLDAAAMGVNTVQREGFAVTHPARFVLIGTMNPEEGDLRPQLLDRFGLMVDVVAPTDPAERAEVVRRRLAFERDPHAFVATWQAEEEALRARIVAARERLPHVHLDDEMLAFIAGLCVEFEVEGLRADITLYKTACTLAAFHERTHVTPDDVRTAAELVLPHRQRRQPFEQPRLDRERLDDLMRDFTETPPSADGHDSPSSPDGDSPQADGADEETFAPSPTVAPRIEVVGTASPPRPHGRRAVTAESTRGRYVRAVRDSNTTDIAFDATLRAALARGETDIQREDLHRKVREGRTGTLIVFVVDASGSMAARRRMEAAKGAVLTLLGDAYRQRDDVALVAFRGPQAQVLLPPTHSVELAERALQTLPTGGRTPLAHALTLTGELVAQARRAAPERPVLVVLITDGKANVPLDGRDPWQATLAAAEHLAAAQVAALVLDTEQGMVRHGRAAELATALHGVHIPLDTLSAEEVVQRIRQHGGVRMSRT
nr:putative cobaltochelatase [Ardenticatena sp.]